MGQTGPLPFGFQRVDDGGSFNGWRGQAEKKQQRLMQTIVYALSLSLSLSLFWLTRHLFAWKMNIHPSITTWVDGMVFLWRESGSSRILSFSSPLFWLE
jgi:hypothetical protein